MFKSFKIKIINFLLYFQIINKNSKNINFLLKFIDNKYITYKNIRFAYKLGCLNIVKKDIERYNKYDYINKWLTFTVVNEQYEIIDYLLSIGADIHYKNDISLCLCFFNNDFDTSKYLLEHGANVNCYDNRPLDYCFTLKNIDLFKLIIIYDVNKLFLKRLFFRLNEIILFKTQIEKIHYDILDYLINNNIINVDNIKNLYDGELKKYIIQSIRKIKLKQFN